MYIEYCQNVYKSAMFNVCLQQLQGRRKLIQLNSDALLADISA